MSELVLWSLKNFLSFEEELLDITTASFAFILIEAVIILWVIVLIFLSIMCTTDISGMIFEEQQVVKDT